MDETMEFVELGLLAVLLIVFVSPFLFPMIEHHLEIFLFVMGCLSMTISMMWNSHIIAEAFREPIPISSVVLAAGFVFKWTRKRLEKGVSHLLTFVPLPIFTFFLVVSLGLISSIITAIIASLILVEIVSILKISRRAEINIVIVACFSIGLGAALTPVGEPLSTITISKMNEDFFYLLKNLGYLIIPLVFVLGMIALLFHNHTEAKTDKVTWRQEDSNKMIFLRAAKVYLFVMALIFLGSGFTPLIEKYVIRLSSGILFWLNTVSAILDNATLAAAEINPSLTLPQIKSLLMALLISGGMLIPGNIPNIIAANKLKIKSSEWARLGVPLGLVILIVYFVILEVLPLF